MFSIQILLNYIKYKLTICVRFDILNMLGGLSAAHFFVGGGSVKTLYLIGGTMGVGKSAAAQVLKKKLPASVMLDGDWCWDMDPFVVSDETKAMVLENICAVLNNFLHCSAFENVIFCWVMHEQAIIDDLLSRLDLADCAVEAVSLVCSREALLERLGRDVERGVREPDILSRSPRRLALYGSLNTRKIDTTGLTVEQTAQNIAKHEMTLD